MRTITTFMSLALLIVSFAAPAASSHASSAHNETIRTLRQNLRTRHQAALKDLRQRQRQERADFREQQFDSDQARRTARAEMLNQMHNDNVALENQFKEDKRNLRQQIRDLQIPTGEPGTPVSVPGTDGTGSTDGLPVPKD